MTNPSRTGLLALIKLWDLAVVSVMFVVAVCLALPGAENWREVLEARISVQNVLFLLGYLGVWHLTLRGFGLYRSYRLSPLYREWGDLLRAVLVAAPVPFVLGRWFSFAFATPLFLFSYLGLAYAGLGFERRLFRIFARTVRRYGRNLRNVIVVGNDDAALDMASQLSRRADLGYCIVEVIEIGEADLSSNGNGNGAGGRNKVLDRIASLLDSRPIDEVFVAVPFETGHGLIRSIVALCEEQGTTVRVVSSLLDLILARAQVDELDGRPVITLFTGPPDSVFLAVKRLIDIVVAAALLLLASPLLLLIAIAIKLDSAGPSFFVQERVGMNGRRFRFFKFRTMVQDAEEMQEALEPLNEAKGPIFKIKNDPRVTRVGRWVRHLSLDELPQLFNVLSGDMSLVGPRPLPLRDVSRIDVRAHKRRTSVKPGITCLWQINGREPSFDEWIKTDMQYIDGWSLRLDLKILVKTIPAVLSGRGAY
jgi:exopolysaccharide biosynthesis polyprenyl glycosylphosphotransferase